jgi:hypothetical protein
VVSISALTPEHCWTWGLDEKDCQPRGSMYDGRSALEMILAVYDSHRQNAVVALLLKERSHPLTLIE